jgi:hypothetical protein
MVEEKDVDVVVLQRLSVSQNQTQITTTRWAVGRCVVKRKPSPLEGLHLRRTSRSTPCKFGRDPELRFPASLFLLISLVLLWSLIMQQRYLHKYSEVFFLFPISFVIQGLATEIRCAKVLA